MYLNEQETEQAQQLKREIQARLGDNHQVTVAALSELVWGLLEKDEQ